MWKVLKKICPKNKNSVPIAKKDYKGKLISDPRKIKKLFAKEYKQRLRNSPSRPDFINQKIKKIEIFELQLKLAERKSSPPLKMNHLNLALKQLKNNKARDHAGHVNEIFKSKVIGEDLKLSLLQLCNNIKSSRRIPDFMKFENITTGPKKGSITNLENERGIFRVDVIRSILMRLVYNEKYPVIDKTHQTVRWVGGKAKAAETILL